MKNPKVVDADREAELLNAFGIRQVCSRARQKKHTDIPCWPSCLEFFDDIKAKSPSFPYSQLDRKRVLYWAKQCKNMVAANKPSSN